MSTDVYAPCPCGSGKKVKFCCAPIVDEMAKVARLQMSEQPRPALQILEKLEKAYPDNPWIVTTQADILLGLNEAGEAKERLERLLKVHPDYPPAFAGLALATLITDGYETARTAIYRALQKCVSRFPQNVSMLALALATYMESMHRLMATRQYLSLAMRLVGDESRENIFVMLLKLDGNPEFPYPMRSVQNLSPYPGAGQLATEAAKAAAWSNIGCWGPAARAFARITEQEPQHAAMWRNVGLCQAWDGDEAAAAQAFHRAAASDDFEFAVECETLAQLCDLATTSDTVPLSEVEFPIGSASRLLGLLDGDDRWTQTPPHEEDEDEDAPVAGVFVIRDKPLPRADDPTQITFDQIPVVVGSLTVLDAVPEKGQDAKAVLRGYAGDVFDSAKARLESLAESEISRAVTTTDIPGEPISREQFPFFRLCQFPPDFPMAIQRSLLEARWQNLVDEVWWNTPQAALDGKSPQAVAGVPEFRVRLAAAAYVLDSMAQRLGHRLDFEALFVRLKLDPPQPFVPIEGVSLSALSPMQFHRLSVSRLTDAQLVYAQRRALLIGHRRFLNDVLKEVLSRPQCLEQVDVDRSYRTLVEIAREEGRFDDAMALVSQAKKYAAKQSNAFELTLSWTVSEFWLRAEQPDDPELPNVYRHLADYYAPKIPQIGALLEAFRRQFGERYSWLSSSELLVESGVPSSAPASGGLWTPSSAAAPSPTPGKLWLPGQE